MPIGAITPSSAVTVLARLGLALTRERLFSHRIERPNPEITSL